MAKQYRAKLDFHHGRHYQVGRAYAGSDTQELLKAGLLEEGEGHNNPSPFEKKFASMSMAAKEKKAEAAAKGA